VDRSPRWTPALKVQGSDSGVPLASALPCAHCPRSVPLPVQVKAVEEPAIQGLRQRVGQLAAELGVGFSYREPAPNFDRRRVKGVLARLFGVRDPAMATALEVVAGGKLYNVVLDSEQTGKQLLTHGNLQRRHTFIPLNKIEGRSLPQSTIDTARRLVSTWQQHPWSRALGRCSAREVSLEPLLAAGALLASTSGVLCA